ncbi:hypothetical protein SLNSH_20925 [Alsobacter soli]|uniref:Uncharacterized protein n=1 Tax=Alsobacter soli TaxID=2109933 RepID=A0A2T1HN71_9HYPH|nr:DUF6481 family protein [Alsobacter soli]PSC03088.1 hypothetical protein SLNSH_20925 [Alsobacter soli]
MSRFNDSLEARQKAAQASRKAMLERFSARPGPDDPATVKKRAAREAINAARGVRRAEAERRRQSEQEAQAAQSAMEASLLQQRVEQEAREAAALKAEQKAARDARYAARKARK